MKYFFSILLSTLIYFVSFSQITSSNPPDELKSDSMVHKRLSKTVAKPILQSSSFQTIKEVNKVSLKLDFYVETISLRKYYVDGCPFNPVDDFFTVPLYLEYDRLVYFRSKAR